jgi:NAD+ synthase (glutamine-hydrolysing)
LKIALAQLNYHIGNFEQNLSKISQAIANAKKQKADLVIFAELAISGYPPRDFLEFDDFIEQCWNALQYLLPFTEDIGVIVGLPTKNPEFDGKDLFNSAVFLADGKIKSIHHKALLPNYDIFDEYRYFEPSRKFEVAEFKGKKLAITICEDLWNIGNDPLYKINPMDELFEPGPDVIVNIAASPFHYEQAKLRKDILFENVKKYKLPLFYVNHVGAQTELLFDGGSLVMNANGELVQELEYFKEDFQVFDLDNLQQSNIISESPAKVELIYRALVMGVKNYFQKLGFSKAILGLSGGIDSAVTAVIASDALGHENVKCILLGMRMPHRPKRATRCR